MAKRIELRAFVVKSVFDAVGCSFERVREVKLLGPDLGQAKCLPKALSRGAMNLRAPVQCADHRMEQMRTRIARKGIGAVFWHLFVTQA